MYDLLRPLLFALDPESSHRLGLQALDLAQRCHLGGLFGPPPLALPSTVFGIRFPNPVGLAAGLDKNAEHLDALDALGFGFIEVGTVTPRPQAGNERPRLFRLAAQEAIINRMGFNNAGVEMLVRNVEASRYRGVLGINIGKNKDTPNEAAVEDYLISLRRVYPLASYITLNISSPNTQGLRDLQQEATLQRFIGRLREAQEQLGSQSGARKPMLLKIAPDLDTAALDDIAQVLLDAGCDGVICANTTIDRSVIAHVPQAQETGGLSGRPLRARAQRLLGELGQRLGDAIPIIGVGGIVAGADAASRVAAGASLVQLYSGLIYHGPALINEAVEAIRRQQANSHVG